MILNFDFALASRQASEVEEIGREMRNLANRRFNDAIAAIDRSWDGETSISFIRHCNDTKSKMLLKASEIENLGKRIRTVARIVKETEDSIRREMQTYSGGGSGGGGSSGGGGASR